MMHRPDHAELYNAVSGKLSDYTMKSESPGTIVWTDDLLRF